MLSAVGMLLTLDYYNGREINKQFVRDEERKKAVDPKNLEDLRA